jgi:hypothetical protein
MDLRRSAGAVILAGILALFLVLSSPLQAFFDLPSLVLMGVGVPSAWWASSGASLPRLRTTLRSTGPTPSAVIEAQETVRAGRRVVWQVGAIATIIGLVQMLSNLSDPAAIGPASAVAVLPLFYSALAHTFLMSPLESRVRTLRATADREAQGAAQLDADLAPSREAMDALRRRASPSHTRPL